MAINTRLRKTVLALALALPGAMLPMHAAQAQISIGVSINIAPPELPVYEQPPLPAVGYLWTPGYWAYGDAGYFWVPGVWVQPPTVGLLWTPGYWGYDGGAYGFHEGYWGPHVGFYGGVNYGFGFGGIGFAGGEWRGGEFAYNSAAANFGGVHVTNVYNNTTIIQQNTVVNNSHTSFNGPGGIAAKPSPQEEQFAHEQHTPPTGNQAEVQKAAAQDRAQLASVNHGKPATPAAANNEAYRRTAAEHAKSQPITPADRAPVAAKGAATPPPARPATEARPAPSAAGQVARPPSGQGALDRAAHPETPAARPEGDAPPRAAAAPRPAPARPAPVARPAAAPPVDREAQPERPAAAAPAQPRAPAVHAEAPRPEAPRPEAARPEAPKPAPREEKEKEKP